MLPAKFLAIYATSFCSFSSPLNSILLALPTTYLGKAREAIIAQKQISYDTRAESAAMAGKIAMITTIDAFLDVINEMGTTARDESVSKELEAKYNSTNKEFAALDMGKFQEGTIANLRCVAPMSGFPRINCAIICLYRSWNYVITKKQNPNDVKIAIAENAPRFCRVVSIRFSRDR